MQGTVDGFSYGLVTPVAAFLMACLGAALGLRCTVRSVRTVRSGWALPPRRPHRAGWLALGATSIGSGIWTMHFIAMMGFRIDDASITYDLPLMFASLAVAIVMVGIGIFIVGYRGATPLALVTGGTITGLGVASMHYLGMAAMAFRGQFAYSTATVALSVVIAVVAATAALWAAVSLHGFLPSLGASVVMGAAVSGMHYTGMAALRVHLHPGATGPAGGETVGSILVPLLVGPLAFLLLAGVIVLFDPLVVGGDPGRDGTSGRTGPAGRGIPGQRRADPAAAPAVDSARGPRRR
ncbi:MHYT domain-containing protein [Streptomyces sp. NPDC005576]|uniref:MHYT domain-containing protein n=1 Tax=unclassified Streptomyces TaxID=2593676 RepID=UPI0033ECABF6